MSETQESIKNLLLIVWNNLNGIKMLAIRAKISIIIIIIVLSVEYLMMST